MSGEKKERNLGEEIIYKLSTNKKFIASITKARKDIEIPIVGFPNDEEFGKWFFKNNERDTQIVDTADSLSCEYGKSIMYSDYFLEYLLIGNTQKKYIDFIEILPPDNFSGSLVDFPTNKGEEFLKKNNEPYVKVLILKNGTKTDVVKAIKENWGWIEDIFAKQGVYRRERIRKTVYKKRNLRIKELCKKSIKELRELSGNSLGEKDSCVVDILRQEGSGSVKAGYVRKICGT